MSFKETVLEYLKFDELKANVIKLIEAKFELKKIEIQDKIEVAAAKYSTKILGAFLGMFAFIFLNILLANFINDYFHNFWAGYLCLVVFYAIISFLIFANAAKITKAILKKIRKATDNQWN